MGNLKKKIKIRSIRRVILFISFFMLPFTMNYFSPVLIIIGGMQRYLVFSHLIYGSMFISSLVVGRMFCSYICPVGGMQEAYALSVKQRKAKNNGFRYIKIVLGIVWLSFILDTIIFVRLEHVNLFFLIDNISSIDDVGGVIRYYIIMGTILLVAALTARRGFCKYICPMSILNIFGTKISKVLKLPRLALKIKEKYSCSSCNQCSKVCPMSLDVAKMVVENRIDMDCIGCGECSDVCKKDILKIEFGRD